MNEVFLSQTQLYLLIAGKCNSHSRTSTFLLTTAACERLFVFTTAWPQTCQVSGVTLEIIVWLSCLFDTLIMLMNMSISSTLLSAAWVMFAIEIPSLSYVIPLLKPDFPSSHNINYNVTFEGPSLENLFDHSGKVPVDHLAFPLAKWLQYIPLVSVWRRY